MADDPKQNAPKQALVQMVRTKSFAMSSQIPCGSEPPPPKLVLLLAMRPKFLALAALAIETFSKMKSKLF